MTYRHHQPPLTWEHGADLAPEFLHEIVLLRTRAEQPSP
jgi:hypothetical protein